MSAICLAIAAPEVSGMLEILEVNRPWIDMAEIRVDSLSRLDDNELRELCNRLCAERVPFIWTVRWRGEGGAFKGSEEERLHWLCFGDREGASYVDVELMSPLAVRFRPQRARLIMSFHDFSGTPSDPEDILRKMEALRPHVLKVSFVPHGTDDLRRIMDLYVMNWSAPLAAIGMGEWGEASRLFPAVKGMPWTYGCGVSSTGTAPGQFSVKELRELYRIDRVSASTPLFAVIGDPVEHSRSPFLHNSFYSSAGIDALYGRVHVDDMEAFFRIAETWGLRGVSVTIPHKEMVVRMAGHSHWLHDVGAANTLFRNNSGWQVDNTDIAAAMECLRERVVPGEKPRVLLLGAGGVSRGLAWGIVREGWELTVCNRTRVRAEALAGELGGKILDWDSRVSEGFDVIINGTRIGMEPNVKETPLEFSGSMEGKIVFDTVYTPENTVLLQQARLCKAAVVTGREMFWRQAALQHGIWFGGPPPYAEMRRIMELDG